ncbi:MAG: gamma-glutamylcyclotransferase [Tabrizicola sp.]|nr:gamma-glutamylcyclotransferase [Tabrizicola sp.]
MTAATPASWAKPATIAPLRLTRALVDRLPPRIDAEGPVRASAPDPDYHARTAARVLAETDVPGTLWVFAAGSLIWNPRMGVAERRVAHVTGWHRAFCIGPTMRFRGSPSAPGLMMSIDRGGDCTGLVLRMQADNMQAALVGLLQKEPPVPPEWITARTQQGPVRAIAFTADPGWTMYTPEPPVPALVDMFATAVGTVGTMAEYLLNTVTELEKAGIHDPHLWQLQALLADRLALLPES